MTLVKSCSYLRNVGVQNKFRLTLRQTYKPQCVCANFVWIIGSQLSSRTLNIKYRFLKLALLPLLTASGSWGPIKTNSLDFWPCADRTEINTPISNMIAYITNVFAAWKFNLNISNATTSAMHHQGSFNIRQPLPPIPPSEKHECAA